ncbi:MAG: LamG domain-containing protein [Planctomycetota bacterium]
MAVLVTAGFAQAQNGGYLQYYGNGWMELPNGVTPTVNLTVEVWARADDITAEQHMIYTWGVKSGCNPGRAVLITRDIGWIEPGYRPYFGVGCDGSTSVHGDEETQEGVWQHIAVTIDDTGHTTLFVNGVENDSGYPGTIGFGNDLVGATWASYTFIPGAAGAVDEVRVWDHPRTQAEIQATMTVTLTGSEPGLIAYWNFDDGTANDVTPNGHDGLLGGDAEIISIADLLSVLADQAFALNLQHGIENSLDAKLDSALQALDDVNQNNDVAAINSLQAFINAVEAQCGNHIPVEQADALIETAQQIIELLL